jgi:peptidoglycan-associated lipoprotein
LDFAPGRLLFCCPARLTNDDEGGYVKRAGFVVATLAVLVVLVATGYAKNEPVQPPIPPPARIETAPPETTPPPVSPAPQTAQPTTLKTIHFGFDKFDIRPAEANILGDNAGYLRDNPQATLMLEGYCDPIGTDEYNRGLGLRRANAAKKYLVKVGIDAARLSVVSYGEEKLVTNDKAQFELNRRVEFVVK